MLVDEQNVFRPDRSCQDHVYTACTVVRNRLLNKKHTFVTFIDLQKAFDFVDRDDYIDCLAAALTANFITRLKPYF